MDSRIVHKGCYLRANWSKPGILAQPSTAGEMGEGSSLLDAEEVSGPALKKCHREARKRHCRELPRWKMRK